MELLGGAVGYLDDQQAYPEIFRGCDEKLGQNGQLAYVTVCLSLESAQETCENNFLREELPGTQIIKD